MADESNAMDATRTNNNFTDARTDETVAGRTEETPCCPDRTAGAIGKALKGRIGPERYRAWFESGTATLRVVGDQLHVDSQNQFVADWIGRHFAGELRTVAQEALGGGARVDVAVAPAHAPHRPREARTVRTKRHGDDRSPAHSAPRSRRKAGRDDREDAPGATPSLFAPRTLRTTLRSLDDFVVGESNRLAFSAARRISEHTGPADTSALLIYGECGVGKTHLLQGICRAYNEFHGRNNAARYLTAEQFTNEYITAVRQHTLEQFRKEYRRLELLAIDDVHFLASKTATQNEFLHTIDAIDLSGARLVLASDQHPRNIAQLHPSLVSRLVARLVVRIDPPDRDTRLTIVKTMAAQRGLMLLDSAAEAIATRCQGSVREIQGILAQVAAMRALPPHNSSPTIGTLLTDQLFNHHDPIARTGPVRMATIIEAVCAAIPVDRSELFSRTRHARVVLARGLVTFLARELTSHSYPEIAQALGRSCHSTVHAAHKRIEALVQRGASDEPDAAPQPGDGTYSPTAVRAMLQDLRSRVFRQSASRSGE